MKKNLAIAVLLTAALVSAQKREVGATVGYGSFGAQDVSGTSFENFGVEACGFCSSRLALFGEYHHWMKAAGQGTVDAADLAAVGLRIQGKRRVRPFFDIGLAGGRDRFSWGSTWLGKGQDSHALVGLALGGGVAIGLGNRWYVRPQFRLYVLSGFHVAGGASVGVGYRF